MGGGIQLGVLNPNNSGYLYSNQPILSIDDSTSLTSDTDVSSLIAADQTAYEELLNKKDEDNVSFGFAMVGISIKNIADENNVLPPLGEIGDTSGSIFINLGASFDLHHSESYLINSFINAFFRANLGFSKYDGKVWSVPFEEQNLGSVGGEASLGIFGQKVPSLSSKEVDLLPNFRASITAKGRGTDVSFYPNGANFSVLFHLGGTWPRLLDIFSLDASFDLKYRTQYIVSRDEAYSIGSAETGKKTTFNQLDLAGTFALRFSKSLIDILLGYRYSSRTIPENFNDGYIPVKEGVTQLDHQLVFRGLADIGRLKIAGLFLNDLTVNAFANISVKPFDPFAVSEHRSYSFGLEARAAMKRVSPPGLAFLLWPLTGLGFEYEVSDLVIGKGQSRQLTFNFGPHFVSLPYGLFLQPRFFAGHSWLTFERPVKFGYQNQTFLQDQNGALVGFSLALGYRSGEAKGSLADETEPYQTFKAQAKMNARIVGPRFPLIDDLAMGAKTARTLIAHKVINDREERKTIARKLYILGHLLTLLQTHIRTRRMLREMYLKISPETRQKLEENVKQSKDGYWKTVKELTFAGTISKNEQLLTEAKILRQRVAYASRQKKHMIALLQEAEWLGAKEISAMQALGDDFYGNFDDKLREQIDVLFRSLPEDTFYITKEQLLSGIDLKRHDREIAAITDKVRILISKFCQDDLCVDQVKRFAASEVSLEAPAGVKIDDITATTAWLVLPGYDSSIDYQQSYQAYSNYPFNYIVTVSDMPNLQRKELDGRLRETVHEKGRLRITKLKPNHEYTVWVKAKTNNKDDNSISKPAIIKFKTLPSPIPQKLKIKDVGCDRAKAVWQVPQAGADHYQVVLEQEERTYNPFASGEETINWKTIIDKRVNSTHLALTDLKPATDYAIKLQAVKDGKKSKQVEHHFRTSPVEVCLPRALSITHVGKNIVDISWERAKFETGAYKVCLLDGRLVKDESKPVEAKRYLRRCLGNSWNTTDSNISLQGLKSNTRHTFFIFTPGAGTKAMSETFMTKPGNKKCLQYKPYSDECAKWQ